MISVVFHLAKKTEESPWNLGKMPFLGSVPGYNLCTFHNEDSFY